MSRFAVFVLSLFAILPASALDNLPNGTLVMSRLKGPIGNRLSRRTGTHWTHTAVVVDGRVWEATLPRSKSTPIQKYGKPWWEMQAVQPSSPLRSYQVSGMRSYVRQNVGRAYGLRQFVNPSAPSNGRIYCSQFAHGALSAAGIPTAGVDPWHTPDKLLQGVGW
jgi:hypothetical protein